MVRIGLQALLKALTRLITRLLLKPFMGPPLPLAHQRRWFRAMSRAGGVPPGVDIQELAAGGRRMLRVSCGAGAAAAAGAAERPAVLFAHGGGFTLGDPDAYLGFGAAVARATGADVYLPDYRLAPEHPFPAPTDDLFAAYRAVLQRGHPAGRTAILGDSAGGALAVSTTLALPEMNVPSPAAVVLISPWVDLSLSGASMLANRRRDPVLRRRFLESAARAHAGQLRLTDPRVSPLFADLANLPPTLIQVGSDEVLLDDATRLADRAWAAGVEVELQRFDGWWHDFQATAATLAGARDALADAGAFLGRRFTGRRGR